MKDCLIASKALMIFRVFGCIGNLVGLSNEVNILKHSNYFIFSSRFLSDYRIVLKDHSMLLSCLRRKNNIIKRNVNNYNMINSISRNIHVKLNKHNFLLCSLSHFFLSASPLYCSSFIFNDEVGSKKQEEAAKAENRKKTNNERNYRHSNIAQIKETKESQNKSEKIKSFFEKTYFFSLKKFCTKMDFNKKFKNQIGKKIKQKRLSLSFASSFSSFRRSSLSLGSSSNASSGSLPCFSTSECSSLQLLCDCAKSIFAHKKRKPCTLNQLLHLRSILEKCTLSDLGYTESSLISSMLKKKFFYKYDINYAPVHVISVYESDEFQITTFVLPKGRVFQYHDHIGMNVVGKLIMGVIDVKSLHCEELYGAAHCVGACSGLSKNYERINDSLVKIWMNIERKNIACLNEEEKQDKRCEDQEDSEEKCICSPYASRINQRSFNEYIDMYGHVTCPNSSTGSVYSCETVFNGLLSQINNDNDNKDPLSKKRETIVYYDRTINNENKDNHEKSREDKANMENKHVDYESDRNSFTYESTHKTKNRKNELIKKIISPNVEYPTTWLMLPSYSNLHQISSKKLAVFIDIISPPYEFPETKRKCRYFKKICEEEAMAELGKAENNNNNVEKQNIGEKLVYVKQIEGGGQKYFHPLPYLGLPIR